MAAIHQVHGSSRTRENVILFENKSFADNTGNTLRHESASATQNCLRRRGSCISTGRRASGNQHLFTDKETFQIAATVAEVVPCA